MVILGNKIEILEEDGDKIIKLDGIDITEYVMDYSIGVETGDPPDVKLDIDAGPEIVFEDSEIKWNIEFPDEKNLRKAMYQKLKNEFEGDY